MKIEEGKERKTELKEEKIKEKIENLNIHKKKNGE